MEVFHERRNVDSHVNGRRLLRILIVSIVVIMVAFVPPRLFPRIVLRKGERIVAYLDKD